MPCAVCVRVCTLWHYHVAVRPRAAKTAREGARAQGSRDQEFAANLNDPGQVTLLEQFLQHRVFQGRGVRLVTGGGGASNSLANSPTNSPTNSRAPEASDTESRGVDSAGGDARADARANEGTHTHQFGNITAGVRAGGVTRTIHLINAETVAEVFFWVC